MELQPRVSVIIGVQHAWPNVTAILERLCISGGSDVEVLICHASDDPLPENVSKSHLYRQVIGPDGALVPELWSLGIGEAQSGTVAILSANCIPDANWLSRVKSLDLAQHVAYGGAIQLPETASGRDTAIHILRYTRVTPPQPRREVREVSADNSVYRRADIVKHADLLKLGFWEPSFHARFQKDGLTMSFEPDLVATHINTYRSRMFLARRFEHGRAFGIERMSNLNAAARWTLLLFSPLAVSYFAAKVVVRALASPGLRWRLPGSLPMLAAFIAAWGSGEITGYVVGILGKRGPRAPNGATHGSKVADQDAIVQSTRDAAND